jgi:hypothetical protein
MTDFRSRRWFQLSLKSLFLLMLLAATFLAGYTLATKQAEAERRRAENLDLLVQRAQEYAGEASKGEERAIRRAEVAEDENMRLRATIGER